MPTQGTLVIAVVLPRLSIKALCYASPVNTHMAPGSKHQSTRTIAGGRSEAREGTAPLSHRDVSHSLLAGAVDKLTQNRLRLSSSSQQPLSVVVEDEELPIVCLPTTQGAHTLTR